MPSLKQTTDLRAVKVYKGPRGFGFNLSSSTAEMPFGMCHYVSKIDAGGAAEDAGLLVGHRIVEVEGVPVKDVSHLQLIGSI